MCRRRIGKSTYINLFDQKEKDELLMMLIKRFASHEMYLVKDTEGFQKLEYFLILVLL